LENVLFSDKITDVIKTRKNISNQFKRFALVLFYQPPGLTSSQMYYGDVVQVMAVSRNAKPWKPH